jgi:hypothetical protein
VWGEGKARTELPTPKNNDVSRVRSGLHLTTVIRWNTSGCEELLVLIHVERSAANGVWLKDASTEIVNEAERGDNEGRRSRELCATRGCGVIPCGR